MNGTTQVYICYSCGERDSFGKAPKHKAGCHAQDFARKDCVCCGHVAAIHVVQGITRANTSLAGSWGCNYAGCNCELNFKEAMDNVQSEAKIECECGASKTGIAIGSILHSHFGYSDPSKWCPARQGFVRKTS